MPRKVHFYGKEVVYPKFRKGKRDNSYNRENVIRQKGSLLSKRSKSKVKNCVSGLFLQREHNYLKWITISLPTSKTVIDGKEIFQEHKFYHRQLSNFIKYLKYTYDVTSYVWVAEIQNLKGRNAIHYHLTVDIKHKVDIQGLCTQWSSQLSKYHKFSKNCIDVEYIKDYNHLGSYLSKYVTKFKESLVYGRVWGCSRDLSKFSKGLIIDDLNNHELYVCEQFPEDGYKVIDIKNDGSDFTIRIATRDVPESEIKQLIKKHL